MRPSIELKSRSRSSNFSSSIFMSCGNGRSGKLPRRSGSISGEFIWPSIESPNSSGQRSNGWRQRAGDRLVLKEFTLKSKWFELYLRIGRPDSARRLEIRTYDLGSRCGTAEMRKKLLQELVTRFKEESVP